MRSAQEIRQALVQIAERKCRPHYTAMVARDVIKAIQMKLEHPLKEEVLKEPVVLKTYKSQDPRVDQLITFCGRRGMQQLLANSSGVNINAVKQIISGSRTLTNELWLRLSTAFDSADRQYNHSRRVKN